MELRVVILMSGKKIVSNKYEMRVMKIVVVPIGEPIFSERATSIEIDDEGGGEFLKITQHGGHADITTSICIDPEEWEFIRLEVDRMMASCRKEDCE